jgi:hypothetical protein
LIKNVNGFEEALKAGTGAELESERRELERTEHLARSGQEQRPAWEKASYYLVPRDEWDRRNCPLMPVDLS